MSPTITVIMTVVFCTGMVTGAIIAIVLMVQTMWRSL